MATNPATAPLAMPSAVGLSRCTHSTIIQERAAATQDIWIATHALVTTVMGARPAPEENPNQPTHINPTPRKENGRWWGIISVRPYPLRGPITIAATSAVTPALMWTTAPPAKSRHPSFASHPPPHNHMARGPETSSVQSSANTKKKRNRTRSTIPPATNPSARVAVMAWYSGNSDRAPALSPLSSDPCPYTSVSARNSHSIDTTSTAAKSIPIVLSAFLLRTI